MAPAGRARCGAQCAGAWIEAAKQEKDVIVSGTWEPREFRDMTAPFRERYPFVNLRYERAGTTGRGMQVLVALNEGRVLVDVMTGIGDAILYFTEAKALADLHDCRASTISRQTTSPRTEPGSATSSRSAAWPTTPIW